MFILVEVKNKMQIIQIYCTYVVMICFTAPSAGRSHLLPVVSDRRQDGAERLDAHGDVQQMSSKEEVVEVPKNGHGGVPDQIQE